ncbi:VOC family protein [Streptacidiphilus sp. N1-10]|uniref:VOC family protein n=1 Tax=Streptacidiphilus jeojiensis TaxID=3229225 RepID=A0ABV6XG86_9ACTN
MSVRSLGYLRLETPDIEGWRRFGADFLGLMPVQGADPESLYFRMDDFPTRIAVAPGSQPGMTALGLEVLDERELDRLAAKVEQAGIKVTVGTEAESAARRVTGFVRFSDPGGNPVELFYGTVLDHVPVRTPLVSKFVTDGMGLGHAIVSAENPKETVDFYLGVLGFIERNTMRSPGGTTYFMGCNPRHHTLGVTPHPGPGRLLHVMVEAATIDDVGLALDRAHALEVPMMHSLGKHTNDHMVSFYVWSPENYAVEFGWNGLQVPEPVPVYEITEGAFWGHRFTPPPAPPAPAA